jgi:hypothetical protein
MDEAAARYQRYYETLSLQSLGDLRRLAAPDMRFRDPFNDVAGVERVIAVLRSGFQDTKLMRFEFLDRAAGRDGVWYYRWRCLLRPRRLGGSEPWVIEGMSEVAFDAAGRVVSHIDHWDAASQFYRRLPLVGWLVERVRRRLQA